MWVAVRGSCHDEVTFEGWLMRSRGKRKTFWDTENRMFKDSKERGREFVVLKLKASMVGRE